MTSRTLTIACPLHGGVDQVVHRAAAQTGHRLDDRADMVCYRRDAWAWWRALDVDRVVCCGQGQPMSLNSWLMEQARKTGAPWEVDRDRSPDPPVSGPASVELEAEVTLPRADFPLFLKGCRERLDSTSRRRVEEQFEFGRRWVAGQLPGRLAESLGELMGALLLPGPVWSRLARLRGAQAETFRHGLGLRADLSAVGRVLHDDGAARRAASLRADPDRSRAASAVLACVLGLSAESALGADVETRDGQVCVVTEGAVLPVEKAMGLVLRAGGMLPMPDTSRQHRLRTYRQALERHGFPPWQSDLGLTGLGLSVEPLR